MLAPAACDLSCHHPLGESGRPQQAQVCSFAPPSSRRLTQYMNAFTLSLWIRNRLEDMSAGKKRTSEDRARTSEGTAKAPHRSGRLISQPAGWTRCKGLFFPLSSLHISPTLQIIFSYLQFLFLRGLFNASFYISAVLHADTLLQMYTAVGFAAMLA